MTTKKRMTQKQRDAQSIAALTKRITDIYSGAGAGQWLADEGWPTAEELSYIVPAVKETFDNGDVPEFVWGPRNLDKFEEPHKIAEQLYRHGVRA